ncbi:phosphoenolpyruvate--protein phosphotransferase [Pokkaliibacter sp. CJK22405]|uniref:phosphoenolpyruvate--protein phosphotransferase n=1 Tax=Pokkaliibacter sp. CJK22405 TaxID=3384615 RepID=UPI003985032C
MLKLTSADIRLAANAADKVEAISQLAHWMAEEGLVEAGYREGMLTRETQTSTYLGNGIAIPHGTPETRDQVKTTGVRVIRFPQGIEWGEGNTVYTAVGIAARSDEHLEILRKLTHVIGDEALAKRVHTSSEADEVRRLLMGEVEKPANGEFLFDQELVRLGIPADSYAELTAIAGALLWNRSALTQHEMLQLNTRQPMHLGEGVWLVSQPTMATNSAAAAVMPHQQLHHGDAPLTLLLAMSVRDEQHLAFLERLMVMKLADGMGGLTSARRPVDLARLLSQDALAGEHRDCPIAMEHGLHARPASALSRLAKTYEEAIWVENLDAETSAVSAKSVTKLISLGAQFGHRLRFTVEGEKAASILAALADAVAKGLGDPVVALPKGGFTAPSSESSNSDQALASNASVAAASVKAPAAGDVISGLAGAPGMAIGVTRLKADERFEVSKTGQEAATEQQALKEAIAQVDQRLATRSQSNTNTELAQILAMHREILADPALEDDALAYIKQGYSAAWSWQQSYEALAKIQADNKDVLLAERAIDIRDVGGRVLAILCGKAEVTVSDAPHILICDEMTPSAIVEIDKNVVLGVVSAAGGVTSHAAILARTLGIPLLVGCGDAVKLIADGTPVVLDCESRSLLVNPGDDKLDAARAEATRREAEEAEAAEHRLEPAIMTDGHHVEVMANLTAAKTTESAVEQGCDGVGLFRSEFIYMDYPQEPDVSQQEAEYARVLDGLNGRPLIVRTLDVGGDKPLPYMPIAREENPFLGIRGVRLSLRYPDTLRRQLRALLSAAKGRDLRIMFPMVTDITEWREIRALFNDVASEFGNPDIKLGIMIEVPSAAMMADVFAKEVDFFSIGTNDLTQYALAIDRGHPLLSRQADALHPAVLRLIDTTVAAAEANGIWVGVCGELASDPLGASILVGLGVKELSMSARAIARVKAQLRKMSLTDAQALAQQALKSESAEAVRELSPDFRGRAHD